MTIDEAINNFTEAAKNHREEQQYWLNERDETSPLYEADRFSLADDSREIAEYYEQLAEWLADYKELKNSINAVKLSNMKEALGLIREYKAENIAQKKTIAEYKRLLKLAVEDNKCVLRENFGDICQFCKHYSNSEALCRKPHNGSGSWCCENAEWRYANESLALIGETNDEP